jgi:two-component system, sporulation sensor kinase D
LGLQDRNIYTRKRQWKWLLFAVAILIFLASLWYINSIARNIAQEERDKIKIWADAINKKATLVNTTDTFFLRIQGEERNKVEIWAEANERLINAGPSEDLTFLVDIITSNKIIPVIITDDKLNILNAKNVDFDFQKEKILAGERLKEFSVYQPIPVNITRDKKNYLYYKESRIYSELREVLDKQIRDFLSEIVNNSPSVPVIITDTTRSRVISGNVESVYTQDKTQLEDMISHMETQNKPIKVDLPGHSKCIVFYENSYLLKRLKYFPYLQFLIIGVFLIVAYLLFSTSRRAEQNKVWLGLARETAHQLGTPLSSLLAWIELLKMKNADEETIAEVSKDVRRLETITERFSKIGSTPKLVPENIVRVIYDTVNYLRSRTSKKVAYIINIPPDSELPVPMSRYLFEWVIENLCKNAIDAMSGVGTIQIDLSQDSHIVNIDISDTGKGIAKSHYKTIFSPGYTSKKVGWGLGLTLSQRIVEQYHSGKIFVKSSSAGKGTTFRIQLKKI